MDCTVESWSSQLRVEKIDLQNLTRALCEEGRILCIMAPVAGVAQLVEQLICNQPVGGSSPSTSFLVESLLQPGVQTQKAFAVVY